MSISSYMTYDIHHKTHAISRMLYDVNRIWHQAQPCTHDTSSTDSPSIYNARLENGAPNTHRSNRKHEPPGHLQPQLQAPNPPTFTTTMTIAESPREKCTQTQVHMLSAHEGSPASERRRRHGGQRKFSARGVRENVCGNVCGSCVDCLPIGKMPGEKPTRFSTRLFKHPGR